MRKTLLLVATLFVVWGCSRKSGDTDPPDLGSNLPKPGGTTNTPMTPALPPVTPDGENNADDTLASILKSEAAKLAKFWTHDRFVFDEGFGPLLPKPTLERRLLAKAEVDECFYGAGEPIAEPVFDGCGDATCPPLVGTTEAGTPKRNGGYVWGLGKKDQFLWLGTISNTHCLVVGGNLPIALPPFENDYYVCEFAASQSGTSDWRRPQILRYDLALEETVDFSPPENTPAGALLSNTTGVRSVGISGDTVILAGPALAEDGSFNSEGTVGINLFAFDVETGALLAAKRLDDYNNIRAWLNLDGVLYTSTTLSQVLPGQPGGHVLRWRGARVPSVDGDYPFDPDALFDFEVVGHLDSGGASLVEHQGRIFISTWPTIPPIDPANPLPLPILLSQVRVAGLYRGPPVPAGGLTDDDADDWTKIWSITDYEPDLLLPFGTTGGALASYEGDLYWGTMNPPLIVGAFALLGHLQGGAFNLDADRSGSLDTDEILATLLGTQRPVSIFRARDASAADPQIELVYGERYLPVYEPQARSYTIRADAAHENRLGLKPLWGASGFGNLFNQYTWTMERFDDSLFIGTFDSSLVLRAGLQGFIGPMLADALPAGFERLEEIIYRCGFPNEGADLLRIAGSDGRAFAESFRGVGNFTNYGVRTMLADDDGLFIGTANPINLHPKGGWELLELTPACDGPIQLEREVPRALPGFGEDGAIGPLPVP